jgi:hypothetical protein
LPSPDGLRHLAHMVINIEKPFAAPLSAAPFAFEQRAEADQRLMKRVF